MSSVPTELNATNDLRELVRVLGLKRSGGEDNLPEAGVDDQVDYALLADRITGGSMSRRRRRRGPRLALLAAAAVVGVLAASIGIVSTFSSPAAANVPMLDYEFTPSLSMAGNDDAAFASFELEAIANGMPRSPAAGSSSASTQVVVSVNWTSILGDAGPTKTELIDRVTALHPDGTIDAYEAHAPPVHANGLIDTPSAAQVTEEAWVHETYAPNPMSASDLAETLPRDPAALKDALIAWRGWSETRLPETLGLVTSIVEIHRLWVVPDDLRQAMWLMLSMQSDVMSLGRVEDRLGREGQAFEYAVPDMKAAYVLIVSPVTGELLGFERLNRDDRAGGGLVVFEFLTLVSSTWEDEFDAR